MQLLIFFFSLLDREVCRSKPLSLIDSLNTIPFTGNKVKHFSKIF